MASSFGLEERTIFDLIKDSRPAHSRFYCLVASVLINALALAGFLAAMQLSAVRRSSERLMAELQKELSRYRMVVLLPAGARPMAGAPVRVSEARSSRRKQRRDPAPLKTPDMRLMRRMDPQLADFVRDNPRIESIVTREIVRDVDNKVLDLSKLLLRSSLQISFGIGEDGQIKSPRIRQTSKVPSIDHLALELIGLLEKYQLLWAFQGLRQVSASIQIADQVVLDIEGEVRDPSELEEVRRRTQGLLAFLRFALPPHEAAYWMDNVTLTTGDRQVILRKQFDKTALMAFLMRYYQQETPK